MAESVDVFSRVPTYHNSDAAYILPNDPTERNRLIEQHDSLVALAKGRVIHAPVSSPDTILDIGCGTGIVTRYLASQFPTANHVYGIDLCSVPSESEVPEASNLTFIRGDIRKLVGEHPRLNFGSADFVYNRLLLCGMTDWPGYVRDVFKLLKPGGWAEMADYVEDVFYNDNRIVPRDEWEWLRSIRAGGLRQGLDLDAGLNIRRYMEDAGFVDIQTWDYRIPFWKAASEERPETRKITEHAIGDPWGLYWHMIPQLLAGMNHSQEHIGRLRMDMRRDLAEEEGKEQLYCVTIGRKPGT